MDARLNATTPHGLSYLADRVRIQQLGLDEDDSDKLGVVMQMKPPHHQSSRLQLRKRRGLIAIRRAYSAVDTRIPGLDLVRKPVPAARACGPRMRPVVSPP
jgi:hypothetical protein